MSEQPSVLDVNVIRKRVVSTIIVFLVGAYLSTWSAALIHSLVFPALGSGPASLSTLQQPFKEKPQVVFAQRRHMPLVKAISLVAPPCTTTEYPRVIHWVWRIREWHAIPLPLDPTLSFHAGRAPPSC